MSRMLLKQTDVYRVDTEEEALNMIQNCKEIQFKEGYTLTKSSYTFKAKKSKGEIVDSWYVVSTEKTFNE